MYWIMFWMTYIVVTIIIFTKLLKIDFFKQDLQRGKVYDVYTASVLMVAISLVSFVWPCLYLTILIVTTTTGDFGERLNKGFRKIVEHLKSPKE